jgi:hypothetical protein
MEDLKISYFCPEQGTSQLAAGGRWVDAKNVILR